MSARDMVLAAVTSVIWGFAFVAVKFVLAAVFLRDIPSLRQWAGMTAAFVGLALIALTTGADLKPAALGP